MEYPQEQIRHPGKVIAIDDKELHVQILSKSACAQCHSKSLCTVADMENKVVDVKNNYEGRFNTGDEVMLVLRRTKGKTAVLLGYIMPFLIVLLSLILFTITLESEAMAGLLALAFLFPYYTILYRYRHKLKERFDFKIET